MGTGGFILGGMQSGGGKTALACMLIAGFRARGASVRPFKVGPDFIDPAYHARYAGVPSRNLDEVLLGGSGRVCEEIARYGAGHLCVVEGVMGLFDGGRADSDEGSTMSLARALDWPIVLVVPAAKAGRSLGASLRGFLLEAGPGRIAGVILNRVGGAGHREYLREALRPLGVPILGAVPEEPALRWPERHLGLRASQEMELPGAEDLAEIAERHLDLGAIEGLAAGAAPPIVPALDGCGGEGARRGRPWRVALARDEAFHFYYASTLDGLEGDGVELVPFSPLHDRALPTGIDALFVGGGFPEIHAGALADNARLRREILGAIEAGLPCHAECGGLMLLCEELIDAGGGRYPMVGAIPGAVEMGGRLQSFGYCAAAWGGGWVPGHEFHHSVWREEAGRANLWSVRHRRSGAERREGYRAAGLRATYVHFHYATAGSLMRDHLGMEGGGGERS